MTAKVLAPTLAVALALVACGDGAPDRTERGMRPKAAERLYSVPNNPCAGLSDGEAAALLGTPADDLVRSELGPMVGGGCSLKSRSMLLKTIVFALHREDSVVASRAAFEKQKTGFAVVVPVQEVGGLGDEAAWFGSKEPVVLKRLLARKGNVWLDVVAAPDGLGGAQRVAAAVLQRLQ